MKKIAAALLLFAAYAWADNPSAVAIRNAKIVTVSGATIAVVGAAIHTQNTSIEANW